MNRDYTHCADCTDECPKDCLRAELTRNALRKHWAMVGWAHFKGDEPAAECREYAKQKSEEERRKNELHCAKKQAKVMHILPLSES